MNAYRVRLQHPQLGGEHRAYTVIAGNPATAAKRAVNAANRSGMAWKPRSRASFQVRELEQLDPPVLP